MLVGFKILHGGCTNEGVVVLFRHWENNTHVTLLAMVIAD